jgi:hypothetical protein
MNNTPLIALVFLAAAASAQSNLGKSGLSYDRVSVGYGSSGDVHSTGLSGTALLGDSVLIGGNYIQSDYANLGTLTSKSTGFSLGYKVSAGDADVIFSVRYAQLQASGVVGNAAIIGSADQLGYGVAWRQKLNAALDYSFAYSHARTNTLVGGYDLATGASAGNGSTEAEDDIQFSLRYSFTKSLDLTLGYDFSLGGGNDGWSISLGYSF